MVSLKSKSPLISMPTVLSTSQLGQETGKEQQITIQSSGGLSDADIEKMVRDAEANQENDRKAREIIETKNNADSLIYSTEKSLKEHKEKIGAEVTQQVEKEIASLRAALESETDPEKLKAKVDELQKAAMKIGEAVYKGASSSSSSDSKDDKTVDAEFEEKNKK